MNLGTDLKYCSRLLSKTPGFSSICVIVLALGMMVSLVSFSFVYIFRYKNPDFPGGSRYVVLKTSDQNTKQESNGNRFNAYTFNLFAASAVEFEHLGAFRNMGAVLNDGDTAQLFGAVETTPNLLTMTQAEPLFGRTLFPSDAEPGADPVVLISENVWRSYYNSDPNIIGQSSRINGGLYSIVGVMPDSFAFPDATQKLWLPLHISQTAMPEETGSLRIVGVLKPGFSKAIATKSINQILDHLRAENPDDNYQFEVEVSKYVEIITSGANGLFNLIQAIAIVILMLCCVNFISLLVVRASARQQELAIRSAIGANARQIIAQILLESFIICTVGFVAALVLTEISLALLKVMLISAVRGTQASLFSDLSLNQATAVLSFLTILAIWLLSGGVTAYRLIRNDVNSVLDGSTKGATSRSGMLTTKVVIGIEVILSVFLVSMCGMFAAGISHIYQSDYGVESKNRYVGEFVLSTVDYQAADDRLVFIDNLTAELRQQAQVADVAFTTSLPGKGRDVTSYNLTDRDLKTGGRYPRQSVIWVSDNYFDLLGVELRSGRFFNSSDLPNSPATIIVSETFASSMWPDQSALGKQIQLNPENDTQILTVVGVVNHIPQATADSQYANRPSFYRPLAQATPTRISLVVQTVDTIPITEATRLMKRAAASVDRNIPIVEIYTLEHFFEVVLSIARPIGNLFIAIALITLVLAVIGIFGVVYRSVLSRKIEIGVRRAMGSSNFKTAVIFLKQGVTYVLIGALFGGALATVGSQLLTSLIVNILIYLPMMLTITVLSIGALILVASYIPARKAMLMEPGDALRYE